MLQLIKRTPDGLVHSGNKQLKKLERKHYMTASQHKGNVVRYSPNMTATVYHVVKCSFCHTHLEVKK